MNQTDLEIKKEILRLLVEAKADINIIAAIGSWKETISDADVLAMLRSEKSLYAFDHGREFTPNILTGS